MSESGPDRGAQGAEEHATATGGTGLGRRTVSMRRTGRGTFEATNPRGGTMTVGDGESADFTPVELLLLAIAGCSAVDVDYVTGRRAEPDVFEVEAEGEKVRDDAGNRMEGIEVTFRVRFPEGDPGDRARAMLPRAVAMSHDRLCTVSRTVQLGAPVTMREA
jgi:uncharacterized OsmC-like protein